MQTPRSVPPVASLKFVILRQSLSQRRPQWVPKCPFEEWTETGFPKGGVQRERRLCEMNAHMAKQCLTEVLSFSFLI